MFNTDGESNYHLIARDLIASVNRSDLIAAVPQLGGRIVDGKAKMPIFGQDCELSADWVYLHGERLDVVGTILVARYLLQAGTEAFHNEWIPYRDFKDGGQFASFIRVHIEEKFARKFEGKAGILADRRALVGAKSADCTISADVSFIVRPLPKVPVLCLFDDSDGEFGATFRFLFDKSARSYLDLESLAVALQYISQKLSGDL
jgi:hypothetical protein